MTRKSAARTIIGALGILSCATPGQADLTPFESFLVPGLSGSIQQAEFADVDGDGVAEVLACDGKHLVLYSPELDSVFLSDTLADNLPEYELELADVNRDSVADVVVCSVKDPITIGWYRSSIKNQWEEIVAPGGPYAPSPECAAPFPIMLIALDINYDGYCELIFSANDLYYSDTYIFEETNGTTAFYHSFPDSMSATRDMCTNGLFEVPPVPGHSKYVGQNFHQLCSSLTGIIDDQIATSLVEIDPSGEPSFLASCRTPYFCSWEHRYTETFTYGCHLDPDTPLTLLCTYSVVDECSDPASMNQESGMIALSLQDGGGVDTLWNISSGCCLSNFLYNSEYPQQFFAYDGIGLRRYDGTNGSLLEQYAPLPAGTKTWVYPYSDGVPYLMNVAGQTVSYYAFDEVTDVETGTAYSLPTTFTLGRPYPNPFNPTVTIPISVDHRGHLRVEVFNPLGQRVATLHDAVTLPG